MSSLMPASLAIDKEHAIHITQGGKPMRNHDCSSIGIVQIDILPELLFVFGIQRSSDVIQNQEFGLFDQGPGDGDTQFCPPDTSRPPVSYFGVILIRENWQFPSSTALPFKATEYLEENALSLASMMFSLMVPLKSEGS